MPHHRISVTANNPNFMKAPTIFRTLLFLSFILITLPVKAVSGDMLQASRDVSTGSSLPFGGQWTALGNQEKPAASKTQPQEPPGWVFQSRLSKQRVKFSLGERIEVTHIEWDHKIKTTGHLQDITEEHLILRGGEGQRLAIGKSVVQKIKRVKEKEKEKVKNTTGLLLIGGGLLVGILTAFFVLIVSVALLPLALLGGDTDDAESEAGAPGKVLMVLLIIGGIILLAFSGSTSVARPFSIEWSVERVGQFPDESSETQAPSENHGIPADMPRA